eukprot:1143917-Pelagomonas_calceolata.AAC.3
MVCRASTTGRVPSTHRCGLHKMAATNWPRFWSTVGASGRCPCPPTTWVRARMRTHVRDGIVGVWVSPPYLHPVCFLTNGTHDSEQGNLNTTQLSMESA